MNTILDQWEALHGTVLSPAPPEPKRELTQLAFYMGAEAVLRILYRMAMADVSEDAGSLALKGLHDECKRFAREYGKRAGIPKDIIDRMSPVLDGTPQ